MKCVICPRNCSDRMRGFCSVGDEIRISRAAAHYWEEPCISGSKGSGTVFFTGCNLKCVFCQNKEISAGNSGKKVTLDELVSICKKLSESGVHNLNFVTPTPYMRVLQKMLRENDFGVPIIYNTSSYESVSALKSLNGLVDVYLADMKFYSEKLAQKYCGRADYFKIAAAAIEQMYSQTGDVVIDENGLIKKGVIVRHLVLPGCVEDSKDIIDWFAEFSADKRLIFSLMSQYTPCVDSEKYPELNRKLTPSEYNEAKDYMSLCSVDGYIQDLSSSGEEYIPEFDLM